MPLIGVLWMGSAWRGGGSDRKAKPFSAAADSAEVVRFVVMECGKLLLFSRITSVTSESGQEPDMHGIGAIEFLTTMSPEGEGVNRGLTRLPHPGSAVYSAPPELLSWLFESSQ